MNIDYEKLNIQTDANNNIINAADLVEYLNSIEFDENLFEYFSSLINRMKAGELGNAEELTQVIDAKLLEYNAKVNRTESNIESLRQMQDVNDDLKKLDIKTLNRNDNDSNKETEYLTYTDEEGNVFMLLCPNGNVLNEYIQKHSSDISLLSAKEIFNYFKENVHKEMVFKTKQELDIEKHNTDFDDIDAISDEKLDRYYAAMLDIQKNFFTPDDEIKIGVNPDTEDLCFSIAGGIFTFKEENGELIRQTIQEPPMKVQDAPKEEEQNPELGTQNQTPELNSIEPHGVIDREIVNDQERQKFINRSIVNYKDIPDISSVDFNPDRTFELIERRDIYEVELSEQEELEMYIGIKFAIESLENRDPSNEEFNNTCDNLISAYLETKPSSSTMDIQTRLDRFNDMEEGITPNVPLSDLEIQFIKHFKNNERYYRETNGNVLTEELDKVKKLVLTNEEKSPGVATVVMLLELIALALLILMFIRIDI